MGLILDTNVLINVEQGRIDFNQIQPIKKYNVAYISVITISELLTGVHLAKSLEERLKRSAFIEHITSKIPALNIDAAVAKTYSELYAYFLRSNKSSPGVHDLQIAATAITHGYPVLTDNYDDFKKIPGVNLIDPF